RRTEVRTAPASGLAQLERVLGSRGPRRACRRDLAPMTDLDVEPLFRPLALRGLQLGNRIVMAPMTRSFSPGGVPGEDVAAYYRRRAEGGTGLLITEGVGIAHASALGDAGLGENDLPHLYGDAALAGWKRVVDAVHAAGGAIVPQLWHQGVLREPGS